MTINDILNAFASSVFVGLFFSFSGSGFLQSKIPKKINSFLIISCLVVLLTLCSLYLANGAKMMTIYIVMIMVYQKLFKKNMAQSAVAALISYFALCIGEIFFTILIVLFYKADLVLDISNFTGSIIANSIICVVAILVYLLVKKYTIKVIGRINDNNKFSLVFTFIMIILAISSLFFKIAFDSWKFDVGLVLNIVVIICLIIIGISIIRQHLDKNRISDEYEKYVEYSKQSEKLVEQYSISQHENQNELIVIKSMVHKNNKQLIEYLDEIISSKDNIDEAWIRYLRFLPFGGLKGLIHNKISDMKDSNINVFLNISKDIVESNLKKLDVKENNQLFKIIGVFLDNAKDAAILSKKKSVSICVYTDKQDIVFEISNTFSEKVNLDKIYNSGYSSKGKNRGYGLSLVKSIVDDSLIFFNKTIVSNEYFIQILRVNKK